jgi:putative transposase
VIEQMRRDYPLRVLCRVLGVSSSGFHARRSRGPSRRAQQEARLEIEIRAAIGGVGSTGGLKELERENSRLKKAVADLTLDKLILREALEGNY